MLEKVYHVRLSSFPRIGILQSTFAQDAELIRMRLTDREDFDILDKTDIKENLLCMIQCLNKVRKRQ